MNVQMPEMDGLEAKGQIRACGLNTRIIAMTAHALEGDREECLQADMNEYISKPIRMKELQKALDICVRPDVSLFEERILGIFLDSWRYDKIF